MDDGTPKSHYLAQNHVRAVAVRKRGWQEPLSIQLETVEISRVICCFECDEEMMFTIGDELDLSFDLGNDSFRARAVIQRIDRSDLLDELFDRRPVYCCCAQFDDELARAMFEQLVGTPLMSHAFNPEEC